MGNTVTVNKSTFEKLRSEQLKKLTSVQAKQIAVLTEALKQYQEKSDIPHCCQVMHVKVNSFMIYLLLYIIFPFIN